MCGLSGFFYGVAARPPDAALLRRMTDALRLRGPDGEGYHLEPGVALGHRRLAIIDLEGGQQPMYNEDHSVVIVFNGEIYNFAALRLELEALGHVFRNRCDTEAIIHAWESWGPACVERLSGMFAFALWDRNRRQLFLARDRLGKKPLYYAWVGDDLLFGSELAALSPFPGLRREIDPHAVEDFLAYGYVPDPATIFTGISKLPAAHTLLIERGTPRPRPRRYWSPPTASHAIGEAEAVLVLREKLAAATAARLIADVPLGAFLSGGVDSGAVVATAAGLRATRLTTFTIGFDGDADETPYARAVAARYGTDHHVERAGATDLIEAARSQAPVFGEPFGDSSSVPTLAVCRLARRHATVAISGDGGDEVFGGYRRYRWHSLVEGVRRHLPAGLRRRAIGRLAAIYPKLDRAPRFLRAKHTLTELSLDSALGYASTVSRSTAAARHGLLTAAIDGYDPAARIAALMGECDDADPLLAAQYVDVQTYLVGDILTKVDRASMAHSLEVRSPFLDHEMVEWGVALPPALKLAGGSGKHVLKQAMRGVLPDDILFRPKQGFATELGPVIHAALPLVRARLLGDAMLGSALFRPEAITRLLDEHASRARDHGNILWLLLCLEGFLAHEASVA